MRGRASRQNDSGATPPDGIRKMESSRHGHVPGSEDIEHAGGWTRMTTCHGDQTGLGAGFGRSIGGGNRMKWRKQANIPVPIAQLLPGCRTAMHQMGHKLLSAGVDLTKGLVPGINCYQSERDATVSDVSVSLPSWNSGHHVFTFIGFSRGGQLQSWDD